MFLSRKSFKRVQCFTLTWDSMSRNGWGQGFVVAWVCTAAPSLRENGLVAAQLKSPFGDSCFFHVKLPYICTEYCVFNKAICNFKFWWPNSRNICVLATSFSKNFAQVTDNYKLTQSIFRCRFPPKYKPSWFCSANFPPYFSPSKVSPSKRAFEKYKLRGLLSEFHGHISHINLHISHIISQQ